MTEQRGTKDVRTTGAHLRQGAKMQKVSLQSFSRNIQPGEAEVTEASWLATSLRGPLCIVGNSAVFRVVFVSWEWYICQVLMLRVLTTAQCFGSDMCRLTSTPSIGIRDDLVKPLSLNRQTVPLSSLPSIDIYIQEVTVPRPG